uniref:Uncharacterized protein n=1 Tax=Melanopsichium pennsylvanicum 4 TaxID=1398559 RepID=A0A077RE15_9BASI|nr:uncharacterized protein BN887_06251 [Melanopsichium pennsylvanicum 4]
MSERHDAFLITRTSDADSHKKTVPRQNLPKITTTRRARGNCKEPINGFRKTVRQHPQRATNRNPCGNAHPETLETQPIIMTTSSFSSTVSTSSYAGRTIAKGGVKGTGGAHRLSVVAF